MKRLIKTLLLPLVIVPAMKIFEFFEKMFGVVLLKRVNKRGENCVFEGYGKLYEANNMKMGKHIFIGRNFFIRAAAGIEIGSYTHISRNVTLHTVNHNIEGELLPYDKTEKGKEIKIGKYVWIGMNVCILPGVTIGDGAVIGMGTIVSKDVKEGDIVVGSGQRIVGKRSEDHTMELLKKNKFLLIKGIEGGMFVND